MDAMSTRAALMKLLADGAVRSGTDLGRALGISRAAVCKAIKTLDDHGIDVERVSGRGYRLPAPLTPLDPQRIRAALGPVGAGLDIEVHEELDSTSQYLLDRAGADAPGVRVCLAECQRAGRGRRGRGWVATPYRNIMLSLGWRYDAGPAMAAGLSLAAGVAAVRALNSIGARDIGLKWPNDLLHQGRKLAGLLVDVRGEAAGPSQIVLGLGVNVEIDGRDAAAIDQPWADLRGILGQPPDRNRLAAALIAELDAMRGQFATSGLAGFRDAWEACHVHAGRPVRLLAGDRTYEGRVRGINDHGALLVEDTGGALRTFYSGEVSLRPAT